MGGESPVVELYDSNGNPLSVQNGSAIPASTPALMIAGSDGTNSRYFLVDSSGRPVMVGAGTAGSPSGGVISIQGVASGTTVPISGTITATQNGNIDAGNSSTVTLAGSGTFTGTGIDVSVYGVVSVFVFTDQAGTLNLEWSINGTNWDDVNSYAVSASTALSIQFGPQARFFRVVYQNGSSAQGTFRLQTIERPITAFPETVPASYTIQNSDNVLLTKTVQGTSPWVENITQFGGNNVVTGTGAGGVGIPRVTVSNDSNVLVTQSTSPWVTNISQFGGNNVVTGTGAGGVGIPRVTVSNDSNILATQSGTWTVAQGAPNTNANKWPVQVTDGTHNMPTMDAIARAGFQEITDGTNGPVAVKAASTAAAAVDPSLVIAFSPNSPLPTGTNVIGAVTQSAGPWTSNITQFGGNNVVTGTGASGVGIPRVTVSNDSNILATQSGTWTVQQGTPPWLQLGNQTAESTAAWTTSTAGNTALALTVTGYGTVTITFNQTTTITGGVVTFEVSDTVAGTNWYPISAIATAGATVPSTTYTLQQSTNASFQTNVAGYVQFRVRLSTTISGTGTVNVGVAANASSAEWQQATYITDASHGPVAVKAASTAAVATDPSLVTAFSPNSPLPTGSNVIGALTANQSVNVAQIAGSATSTAAAGVQKVGIVGGAGTSLETSAGVIDHNLKNVSNSAVATAATGVQKVGIVGSTGTALDGTTAGILDENIKNVAGNAVVTAATGVQKVGIVGGTGTSFETTAGVMDHNLKNVGNAAVTTLAAGEQKVAVEGLAASGSAVSGNPVLVAGKNSSGNAGSLITDGLNSLITSIGANEFVVQSNATVTTSGSSIITTNDFGTQQINLIINITAAPTGTTPTLTYTLQEVDPGNGTTTMGNSSSSAALNSTGVTIVTLGATTSNVVKVSWVIAGSSASFTGVYTTVVTKSTPATQQVSVSSPAAIPGLAFGRVLYGGTSGVLTAIRATAYTEQTTNFTGSVKSTSANDASAGTGARTVIITYYDQTGAGPLTETVTLNGTTAVNLVNTNHSFIEKMAVVTVGSTGSNAGTISLFTGAAGAGTTVGSIGFGNVVSTAGDNTTYWSHHYTPINKTSSIYLITGGTTGNQTATVALRSQPVLTANSAEIQVSNSIVTANSSDSVSQTATNPIKITGFARTTLYVVSNGSNTTFVGGFDYSDL